MLYKNLLNVNFIFKSGPIKISNIHTVLVAFFLCREVTEESEQGPNLYSALGKKEKRGTEEMDSLGVPTVCQC